MINVTDVFYLIREPTPIFLQCTIKCHFVKLYFLGNYKSVIFLYRPLVKKNLNRKNLIREAFLAWTHVMRIWNAEVAVEALPRGQKLRLVADVPFADAHRGVVAFLQPLGDGELRRVQPVRLTGEINPRHRHARAVAAGEQLRARHRADGGGVEAGELHPLAGHAVEIWRVLLRGAERPDVRVAEVVDEDDDEVGLGGGCGGVQRSECGEE